MAYRRDEQLIGERREQLLQAAARCFAEKGYARTTAKDHA
ncbi:MAG: TetR family transcriptional regulator [Armatimonadetes bacterium]|nr:TetR family transcriptional regulator [Armatimonadota bacterium]